MSARTSELVAAWSADDRAAVEAAHAALQTAWDAADEAHSVAMRATVTANRAAAIVLAAA